MEGFEGLAFGEADRYIMARVFWEQVIHPECDVSFDEESGEFISVPRLDDKGREVLDLTPVEIPVPFERPEPLHLRIRRIVLEQLSRQAQSEGEETFADFEDFGEDDDGEFASPYELPIDNLPVDDIRPESGVQSPPSSGGDTTTAASVSSGNNSPETS